MPLRIPFEYSSSQLSDYRKVSFNPPYYLQPFTYYSISRLTLPPPSPRRSLIRYRNIYLFPFDYASRPRLRHRLTLPRLTLDRNPWSSGEAVCHCFYRYLRQHSHFCYLQCRFLFTFFSLQNAPLPLELPQVRSFGVRFSPVTSSAQADSTSELLRFL